MDFRGDRGGTQRKPYDDEHGRPLSMLCKRQLVDIRRRNFTGSARESELPILYRLHLKDNITLGEGRGNAFIMLLKERRKEIAATLLTPNIPGSPVGAILEGQARVKASGRR